MKPVNFNKNVYLRQFVIILTFAAILVMAVSVAVAKPKGVPGKPHGANAVNTAGVIIGSGGIKVNKSTLNSGALNNIGSTKPQNSNVGPMNNNRCNPQSMPGHVILTYKGSDIIVKTIPGKGHLILHSVN